MSSGGRLSKEQKGKAVATETSPVRVVNSTLPSDFEVIHCEAMMDTTNMDTSQRVLVAESARLIREESWSLSRKIVREMVEVDRVTERSLLLILFRAATILKGFSRIPRRWRRSCYVLRLWRDNRGRTLKRLVRLLAA